MGSGAGGPYTGTRGSNNHYGNGNSSSGSTPRYTSTPSLRNHINNVDSSTPRSRGIGGAHNRNNFINEANKIGAKIENVTPSSQINGVENITYRMPSLDKTGNPTGSYKAGTLTKTVYDPSVISTDAYIQRGLQAANNAAKGTANGHLGREWRGVDNHGVIWHGYCNGNGEITSFFPIF